MQIAIIKLMLCAFGGLPLDLNRNLDLNLQTPGKSMKFYLLLTALLTAQPSMAAVYNYSIDMNVATNGSVSHSIPNSLFTLLIDDTNAGTFDNSRADVGFYHVDYFNNVVGGGFSQNGHNFSIDPLSPSSLSMTRAGPDRGTLYVNTKAKDQDNREWNFYFKREMTQMNDFQNPDSLLSIFTAKPYSSDAILFVNPNFPSEYYSSNNTSSFKLSSQPSMATPIPASFLLLPSGLFLFSLSSKFRRVRRKTINCLA